MTELLKLLMKIEADCHITFDPDEEIITVKVTTVPGTRVPQKQFNWRFTKEAIEQSRFDVGAVHLERVLKEISEPNKETTP